MRRKRRESVIIPNTRALRPEANFPHPILPPSRALHSDIRMIVLLPIVRAIPPGHFYQNIATGIADALQELGHTVQWFPLGEVGILTAPEAAAAVRWAHAGGGKLVIDLCCWGHAISQAQLAGGIEGRDARPAYDVGEVSCVGFLLDQAYFQPIGSIHCRRLYAAISDPNILEQIALISPSLQLAGSVFAPPAANLRNDRSVAWAERDIDLLYVGNLHLAALQRQWSGGADVALCDALADAANADEPLHRTALKVARALGRPPDAVQWGALLRDIEFFLRAKSRLAAVLAAARSGVDITVIGNGWDTIELPANISVLPPTYYEDVLQLVGRSRICLDASSYPHGANDRIFNYALNRAVCLTNSRSWVERCFGPEQGMHFYQSAETQTLTWQIPELLARPQQLQQQGEAARAVTLAGHTWRHRIEAVLGTIAPD